MVTLKVLAHFGNNGTAPVPKQTQLSTLSIGMAGMACFCLCLPTYKIRMSEHLFNTKLISIALGHIVPTCVPV